MSKKIVYVGGFWSTNIGNAFFDLGCLHALKKACPDADVLFAQEQTSNFWSQNGYNPKNSLDYIGAIDADYIVIAGPMLDKNFEKRWGRSMPSLKKRGTKIVLLSAGAISYDEEEKQLCRKFMEEFKPHAIITRDRSTYDDYHDLSEFSYDGICCAFFSADYFNRYKLNFEPYVVFNFEKMREPYFRRSEQCAGSFEFSGSMWSKPAVKINSRLTRCLGLMEFVGYNKERSELAGYNIIRTKHTTQPSDIRNLFNAHNTLASDVPYDYLNIYANAEAVFSDRVHACVPALSFGKKAMLFSDSPRARLFDRIGMETIKDKPVSVDLDYLEKEKSNLLKALGEAFQK